MVNAWSLAASILDGTFDEDYPIMKKKEIDEKTGLWKEPEPYQHSNYYYDYTRNDPDAENPFTEAFDYLMGESVTEKHLGFTNHLMVVKLFIDMNVELTL